MIDTKELRGAADQMKQVCTCKDPACTFARCIEDAADELDALRKERDELGKVLKIKAIALDYVVSSVSWLSSCPSPMSHFSFEEMLDKIHEFVTSPLIASEVETHIGYSETNLLISIDDYAEERKKSDDEITALRARVSELETKHLKIFNAETTIEMLEEGLEARKRMIEFDELPDDLLKLEAKIDQSDAHTTRRNVAVMKLCKMVDDARARVTEFESQLAEARELIKEAITIIRDKTISDTKGVLRIHAAIDAAKGENNATSRQ